MGLYFLLPSLLSIPFLFFIKKRSILYLIIYSLTSFIFLLLYRNDLKEEGKDFIKNRRKYVKTALFAWLIGTSIMIFSNYILNVIGVPPLKNQEDNIRLFQEMPITQTIITTLFSPIIEEIAFRKSFNKAFSSPFLFILFTSTSFAFLHIFSSLNNPLSLFYLIPFLSLGITLSFTYKKTSNIFSSISIHAFHNIITLIDIFILGGLL